jgi:hypothetical protein
MDFVLLFYSSSWISYETPIDDHLQQAGKDISCLTLIAKIIQKYSGLSLV